MRHGRWRSASVMRGYGEEGDLCTDNAAARFGVQVTMDPSAPLCLGLTAGVVL